MYYNFNPMFNFRQQVENQVTHDPRFKEFYEKNKDKTPEQVAKEYGLDWNTIKNFFK